eukprot:gb/GFBE01006086.1/.p1 GENE.gb/GFBE01006086.1/~~gb/GFBE01006086.1/.p1  ORF type:complete len:303 (+),score=66.92 gb/GFBE01006086.1/:1-909(+)
MWAAALRAALVLHGLAVTGATSAAAVADAIMDDSCEFQHCTGQHESVAMLQFAAYARFPHREQFPATALVEQLLSQPHSARAVVPVESPGLPQQMQEDAEIRRQDAALRAANSKLKRELLSKASLLASHVQTKAREKLSLRRLTQPLPATLIAAGLALILYWSTWISHMMAFFLRRQQYKRALRTAAPHDRPEEPIYEEYEKEMNSAFCCCLGRKTVRNILLLLVAATACGSYLGQYGYFEEIREKIVPQLYFAALVFMVVSVIIHEVFYRFGGPIKKFQTAFQTLRKHSEELANAKGLVFG